MSAYAVIRYNEVFSKAACVSSSIVFCLRQMLSEFDHKPLDPDTRVYLSWGTCEARGVTNPDIEDVSSYAYKCNKAIATRIEKAGASAMMYCQIGGHHCEADWEKQIPIFMDYLWMH